LSYPVRYVTSFISYTWVRTESTDFFELPITRNRLLTMLASTS
jgi:hypothetical protein